MSLNSNRGFLEQLENRTLMSVGPTIGTFVYVESNDNFAGQNAVLGYSENAKTGALTPLPNGRFPTDGTGERNAGAQLGPDDSDKEVIASPDGNYLFAVNQGSDTIAVFAVHSDGSLSLVNGAPFASGGTEPVSLSFNDGVLYVVNKGNSVEGTPGTIAPDVTAFNVLENGRLSPIPDSTVNLPLNLSPAQVLASADGKFEFVDDFATPSNLKVSLANTIEPFVVGGDGSLSAVSGGAAGLPGNPPLVLGLVEDPVHHIIYSGQAPLGGVATFSYNDTTGRVSYVGAVASQGKATCWLNISPNGKYLYGTDSASDAISVYSLANPYKPALIQEFALQGPQTGPYDRTATGPTSQDFQFSFDPTGKFLWVLNHTTDDGFQHGNQLHSLTVAGNGLLSESAGSVQFFPPNWVPGKSKVIGLAVITPAGYYGGYAPTAVAQPAAQIADVFSTEPLNSQSVLLQLLND